MKPEEVEEISKQLGISVEEFLKKKVTWLKSIQSGNKERRKQLLEFIETSSGLHPSQSILRGLSWEHTVLLKQDNSYAKQVETVLRGLTLPIFGADSPQDRYHLTHFVNALLLCLYGSPQPRKEPVTIQRLFEVEENEEARAETLQLIYQTLKQLLPKTFVQIPQNTLTNRVKNLEQRVEKLERSITLETKTETEKRQKKTSV
jgi:hypothetical protein